MPDGEFYPRILQEVRQKRLTKDQLTKRKLKLCAELGLKDVPTDIQILLRAPQEETAELAKKLLTKPVRSISGVTPIALMTAPFACKHGKCVYCPGGPGSPFGDVPQSYTGREPSTMRAIRNAYDPYLITFNRCEQYIATGHTPDKVEFIIQGGTFPSFDLAYQEDFITYALKALNDFGSMFFDDTRTVRIADYKQYFEMPGDLRDTERAQRIREKELAQKGTTTLIAEQERNETARLRCVALCIETKPDWCLQPHIDQMLRLGTTRVELGVQCLRDDVLKATNRGHGLAETIEATQLMKDSLLKVGYHMMPGLPGQTRDDDIAMFSELFQNADYMPDALKIYPCMVFEGTPLFHLWKRGAFTPIELEQAADIIVEAKKVIPRWCRIMRIQRDIPSTLPVAGIKRTNLRQDVERLAHERGVQCQCIRCREPMGRAIDWNTVRIARTDYDASEGKEIFLAAEDTTNNILLGFCRMRKPGKPFRPEITTTSAGIRELHVYGAAVAIGAEGDAVQHKGLGKRLLAEAERIAKEEWQCDKMLVIAGIGVREYYWKLGYANDGAYVSKTL